MSEKKKTLDLDCIDEFDIDLASSMTKDTDSVKHILEEVVSDPSFTEDVRKKIKKAIMILED